MAYLRKEKDTVEIDYPLDKVWAAVPKALASLQWTIEEKDDAAHHAKVKTEGAFLSYPSVLMIDAVAVDEKTARFKVTAETPVTTITAMADFGRSRDRIDLFFEALAKQLYEKTTREQPSTRSSVLISKENMKHENSKEKRGKTA